MNHLDYLKLSSVVYDSSEYKPLLKEGFKIIASHNNPDTGYVGHAYLTPDNTVIIAHRGTDTELGFAETRKDWESNIQLGLKKVPEQYYDADKLMHSVKDVINDKELDIPLGEIEHTGHSLGGALAQLQAHRYGQKAVAFDPPGTQRILEKIEPVNGMANHDSFETFVARGSFVSGVNTQVGKVTTLDVVLPEEFAIGDKINVHGLDVLKDCFDENGNVVKSLEQNPEFLEQTIQKNWEENGTFLNNELYVDPPKMPHTIQEEFGSIEEYKAYYLEKYNINPVEQEPSAILESIIHVPLESGTFDLSALEDAEDLVNAIELNVDLLSDNLNTFRTIVDKI